jgi:hypothetical protein
MWPQNMFVAFEYDHRKFVNKNSRTGVRMKNSGVNEFRVGYQLRANIAHDVKDEMAANSSKHS